MTDPLSAAESKLGDPYQWGATGPDAFDCSGLTQWAYQQAGIRLPRTSQQQRDAGTPVSLAAAEPGDLITYSYPGEDGNPAPGNHVGLFVRPGLMIDAPHSGASVQFDPIDTAHLDRVVHVGGGAGGPSSTLSADFLQSSGVDPSTWPGTIMAGWNPLNALGDATGSVAAKVTATILRAAGPLMVNAASLALGGSLIVLGLWRMTEPTRKAAEQKAETAAKAAAVLA